ncbi:MAG: LysR family transcriptional regulator [Rhizobiaceae bacterium]|nr:LysR family transcriptional regulator [Rhizobiaceae bacterium]
MSKAADEMNVTQSAVSHQIRRLTEMVGERLVVKSGRGVMLTPIGEVLAQKLRTAFSQIDRSVAEVIGGDRDVVRLALCSSFAPGWLIPRLRSFYEHNPRIKLQLRMYARDPDLTDEVADAFITTLPSESGFWSSLIRTELLVPVIAKRPAKGQRVRFITTDMEAGSVGKDWLAYQRIAQVDLKARSSDQDWMFASHYIMALDMVREGLGAALVPDFLAAEDLKSGRVVLLHHLSIATNQDYFLCIKEVRRQEPALVALARWFKAQANHAT